MQQAGADTGPITTFLAAVSRAGAGAGQVTSASVAGVAGVAAACGAPAAAVQHLQATLRLALQGGSQEVAAVFTFGREEMIPRMFSALLAAPASCAAETSIFRYYLARHIELEGASTGPSPSGWWRLCAGRTTPRPRWRPGPAPPRQSGKRWA